MLSPARTWHWRDFDAGRLADAKGGRTVALCLPARDEQSTVGDIVEVAVGELVDRHRLVDEVVVVDDGSADATAEVAGAAGARVVSAADVLPQLGPGRGKGEAMWKSLAATTADIVVWCDADIVEFSPRFVVGLAGPLLLDDRIAFVKGFYERPVDGPTGGGRVTELVARPLLSHLFPHLTGFVQPLAGEYAGRREVLEQVPFVQGYGVDLALLVDLADVAGLEALAQVDLGVRIHRNRSLAELSPQAMAVLQTALRRAGVRPAAASEVLVRPGTDPVAVPVVERPPMAQIRDTRHRSSA